MILLQLCINTLIAGALTALVAVGFSIIYSSNRFVHFAHGGVVSLGAYILFYFFITKEFPFAMAATGVILCTVLIGLLLFGLVYYPLQKRRASGAILLIASLALIAFIQNITMIVFGSADKTIHVPIADKLITIGGATVTWLQLLIIGTAFVLLFTLWFFSKYTKIGTIIRAVSANEELANITGINIFLVRLYAFLIGSALAGVAGILISLEQSFSPFFGTGLIIQGYTGAVIGGVTSWPGAVLGSFLLATAENFGIWYLPSGYKEAIAFILMVIFLLLRPSGILGVNKGARENN